MCVNKSAYWGPEIITFHEEANAQMHHVLGSVGNAMLRGSVGSAMLRDSVGKAMLWGSVGNARSGAVLETR